MERSAREGQMSQRHPTIEAAIEAYRGKKAMVTEVTP